MTLRGGPAPIVGGFGLKGGRTVVRWDGARWVPQTPAASYAYRCQRFVRAAKARSFYVVIGYVDASREGQQ